VRLGFAVKVLGGGGLRSHDTRRWQSGPHLRVSLEYLRTVLDYLDRNDLRMYRMPSGLAPYASHPELPQFHNQVQECAQELSLVGTLARGFGVRLSMHPGQYTVLNSENRAVVSTAVAELEVQAALLDALGLGPEAVVVLHVGGGAGGRQAGADRFCAGFELLSEAARRRLVLENDDRIYDVSDVVAVSRRLGVPVVWDLLHHHCNDREHIPDREALGLALGTWPSGVTPKIHFSSPRLDLTESTRQVGRRVERKFVLPDLRHHADLIDPVAFEQFLVHTAAGLHFDVMLEAKAKDLAVLRLREQLTARGIKLATSSPDS
jgi:UV DNA damage endonuclease